jgi:hypothetical protein
MPKRCRAHGHTLPRTPPPSLELMDAARSYEHGRDAYLDHLGGKSRPGKPCASTRGFSCRCRRDGAQPAHSRISRGEHADRRRCPDPSPSCSRRTWHRQTLAEAWRSRASKLPPLSAVILNRGAVQNRATAPQARLPLGFLLGRGRGRHFGLSTFPCASQVQGLSAPCANVPSLATPMPCADSRQVRQS